MERNKEIYFVEYWLKHYGMPQENIERCMAQIAQGYGAWRYLDGVSDGAEAVANLTKEMCFDNE